MTTVEPASPSTVLTRDGAFLLCDPAGDISQHLDGLFLAETRHLSRWMLTVDGQPPLTLARQVDGSTGATAATEQAPRGRLAAYEIRRVQAVTADGLAEHLELSSFSDVPLTLHVRYECEADFADQFELRGDKRYPREVFRQTVRTSDGLRFDYRRDWFERSTFVHTSPPPAMGAQGLQWIVELAPKARWQVNLSAGSREQALPPVDAVAADAENDVQGFLAQVPVEARGNDSDLGRAVRTGLRDLADLRVRLVDQPTLRPVGAGVPWFLTLFGRDSLITSFFALPYLPSLAADTLRALAAVQGSVHDRSRIEEPGKIAHELRAGELSVFGDVPYRRYYGTVDATALFLILLAHHHDQSRDELARELELAARAAVAWMHRDGGLDEHGYLVYRTDLPGLVNQCWKDSAGAICFPSGEPATGPIAVCEAQGYAYDALRRTARVAREVWSDLGYADRLDAAADALQRRFLTDFWCAQTQYPALALDGQRRPIPTITSNPGHLLWSGILDPDRALVTGRRLLAPDLFTGWGIRTLAAGQPAYHPISYHRGGVWPHDTALAVAGLARYGMHEEATTVAHGLIDAATALGGRLPELIVGHDRAAHPSPLPYPHACTPQAWASATPLLLASALADSN